MSAATQIKICGISDNQTLISASRLDINYIGLVFYPPSPRFIRPDESADICRGLPSGINLVGLFVDPDDSLMEQVITQISPAMIQLHGNETPERVTAVKRRFSLPVMKALRLGGPDDLEQIERYEEASDWLLFDSKPSNAKLPGGTGHGFDWNLLAGRTFSKPWMLSGGLHAGNVAQALSILKPAAVDVSSGVESAPGIKDLSRMESFVEAVKSCG